MTHTKQSPEFPARFKDLQRVWNHERTPPQLRKRLLRAVLVEIIATIKGREIHLLLHWKGGDHSHLVVPRNRTGEHRWTTDAETGALIGELARMLPDELIAGLLNRLGRKTGKGNNWTKSRVCSFRCARHIAVYREGERQERGELILSEAAEHLGVGRVVVRRLIRSGALLRGIRARRDPTGHRDASRAQGTIYRAPHHAAPGRAWGS